MRITTGGESHGKVLIALIEGLPAGLSLDTGKIDAALKRRQSGYGRGPRQKIEDDRAEILSGVRNGVTLGSPIAVVVRNSDYENWKTSMAPEGCDTEERKVTRVRPGHADLAGMLKYGQDDARNVLERASARETAVRVAAGEICRQFLSALGIEIAGYVRAVGGVSEERTPSFSQISEKEPTLGMLDEEVAARARVEIDRAKAEGDTLGGVCEIRVRGLKSGFGSCMTYSEKLDARLAAAMMSVQAVKGVEVGLGFSAAGLRGSAVHDEIFYGSGRGYYRKTNRAGGIEGGMSNGEELVLRAAMKPIPTLGRGLGTVDVATGERAVSAAERSDVCAVTACEVVLEAAIACALAEAVCDRLGGDTLAEVVERYGRLPQ